MKTIKPKALKQGDKVGVISPSEPVVLKKQFSNGVWELEKLGLKVVLGKNVFKSRGGYMAGTVKERLDDLHAMFADKSIKAIFTSRGGYCANQLLPHIDFSLIKKNPKIILGYSDISVLLNAIHTKTGLVTFHGPSVEFVIPKWDAFTKQYFVKALFGHEPIGAIPWKRSWSVIRRGTARGRLLGGNLSVIRTLLGTKYAPDWKGAILFWEDCDFTYEDMDHFLTHLKLAGVFEKISGMVAGKNSGLSKMERSGDLQKKDFLSHKQIILQATQEYDFPVISDADFGHNCPQITIPVGARATLDTAKKLFSIDEPGVQ